MECEEYFKLLPKIKQSQEKMIVGIKQEIRTLDNEINALQMNLATAIRKDD